METKNKRGRGVRIIAGRWRGRRLPVVAAPGLRPSPDRLRETLFNWLQPRLPGSRCLDLFAGSGALGLEAASRDAREVVLVENNRQAIRGLEASIRTLQATAVRLEAAEAGNFLGRTGGGFDLVFLDPPFGQGLVGPLLRRLFETAVVSPGGLVYVEMEAASADPVLPPGWLIVRRSRCGDSLGRLLSTPDT